MNAQGSAAGSRCRVARVAGALALAWSLTSSMSGCITINIYFPAAAAEKAADRIIDDVLGKGAEPAPAAPPK